MQNELEISNICKHWLQYHVRNIQPHYLDDEFNAHLLRDFIIRKCNGVYSLDNLDKAVADPIVAGRLHWRGESMTAEEIRKKAEEEKLQTRIAATEALINDWLQNHCPTGLLGPNNEPYAGDVDRIRAFLSKNYNGVISTDALTDAIRTLSNVLTWFDRSPEAMELRNQPAPPPRRLSEQAQIDAGMKPVRMKGHEADREPISMAEVARKAKALFDKQHGIDPDAELRAKAEILSVGNHLGKIDHAATGQLRQIIAKNPDGTTNWKETYRARNIAADNFERTKNRR